jgi:HSP20 family protein
LAEYARLDAELKRYLEGPDQLPRVSSSDGSTPLADVEESDEVYTIELDLPGVSRDHLDVALAGRRITISGARDERERKGVIRRHRRKTGRFLFEITLPVPVDEGAITVSLDAGVLTVRVRKGEADRPRRIQVD